MLSDGTDVQLSATIPWDYITIKTETVYQTHWNIDLKNNTEYHLVIISESSFGQSISDSVIISKEYSISENENLTVIHLFHSRVSGTFDVTSIQYTVDNSTGELCVSCNFSASTLAKGCLVILINTDSAPVVSLRISRNISATTARDCTTLSDNGYYLLTVYDWEEDGGISDEPAEIRNIIVTKRSAASNSNLNITVDTHSFQKYRYRNCVYVISVPVQSQLRVV